MYIIAALILGMLVGRLLRKQATRLNRPLAISITAASMLLLFLLGINTGDNTDFLETIMSLGWQSFVLSVLALAGSIVTTLTAQYVYRKHRARIYRRVASEPNTRSLPE